MSVALLVKGSVRPHVHVGVAGAHPLDRHMVPIGISDGRKADELALLRRGVLEETVHLRGAAIVLERDLAAPGKTCLLEPGVVRKAKTFMGTHGGTTVERVHRIDNRRTGFDGERDFVLVQIREVLPAAVPRLQGYPAA